MAASSIEFKRGSRVVATDDLPGVPEGTGGKVGRAVGFTLTRYRVRFDNKVEMTSVASDKLVAARDWDTYRSDREVQREAAVEAAAQAAALAALSPAQAPAPTAEAPPAEEAGGGDPRLAALMAKSKAAKASMGISEPDPPPAAAPPVETAAAAETGTGDAIDPRLAALSAKSRSARSAAGVDLDAEAASAPAPDPEPVAAVAKAPSSPPKPSTPTMPDGYFPVDNRVADLLAGVTSGEIGQP